MRSLHPEVELARADVHIAWLEERIALARFERWEQAMIATREGRLAEERRLRDEVEAMIAEAPHRLLPPAKTPIP